MLQNIHNDAVFGNYLSLVPSVFLDDYGPVAKYVQTNNTFFVDIDIILLVDLAPKYGGKKNNSHILVKPRF